MSNIIYLADKIHERKQAEKDKKYVYNLWINQQLTYKFQNRADGIDYLESLRKFLVKRCEEYKIISTKDKPFDVIFRTKSDTYYLERFIETPKNV
jgi:hypothetical protein